MQNKIKFQILSKNFHHMISLHDITVIHNIFAGSTDTPDMIKIPEIHTLMQIYSESLKRLLLFL